MKPPSPLTNSHSSRLRDHLLYRIRRRFPTVTEQINLGSLCLEFTRAADPNRVLDEIVAEESRRADLDVAADPLHLPYWAELWDSALGLGKAITHLTLSSSSRVLDLGCGMGFAGTVAAALGATVLFADMESPPLLFARLNSLPFAARVRTRRLNWQVDRLRQHFDLILGADILYEQAQWQFLDAFWKDHLAPNGAILLGEPGRQSGDLFAPWIRQQKWALQETPQPIPAPPFSIRIFRLTRT